MTMLVGGNQKSRITINDELAGDGDTDVEGRSADGNTVEEGPQSEARAPLNMVGGRPWSPGVYRNLRLMGVALEVAWERAFVRTSLTFNI